MELNTVGDWKKHFEQYADDMIVTITQKPVVSVSPAPAKPAEVVEEAPAEPVAE